jgi:methyl-accepting chemotaxis protein
MARNTGLAVKLGIGFGVVVVIACVLGMLGVFNMSSVKTSVLGLTREEVPQVTIANNIQKETQDMLYALRGYVYTFRSDFYDEGNKKLAEVIKYIKNAEKLGESSPALAKLKDDAQIAMAAVNEYEKALNETSIAINNIQNAIKEAGPAGFKILENCKL